MVNWISYSVFILEERDGIIYGSNICFDYNMLIHDIYKRYRRVLKVLVVPRQLCNTIAYHLCNKKNVIVVNAAIFQFCSRIRHHNLGDDLNYYLIKTLSGKKMFANRSFYHNHTVSNIMAIGSVIDWMANNETIVWGAGMMKPVSNNNICCQPKKVLAVRGRLTRESLLNIGIECPEVYGDPALLLPLIYNPKVEKVRGRIGFIPHYEDIKDENINRLMGECQGNAFLIKMQKYNSWKDVIKQILSCEYVVSTSLHGLILSDAYGIPNQWIRLQNRSDFKYKDYYSSVGKEAVSFDVTETTHIEDLMEMKKYYKSITFDPKPLLESCPFAITHSEVLKVLNNH